MSKRKPKQTKQAAPKRDMAQAALEKPVKAIATDGHGGGVVVTYENGEQSSFVASSEPTVAMDAATVAALPSGVTHMVDDAGVLRRIVERDSSVASEGQVEPDPAPSEPENEPAFGEALTAALYFADAITGIDLAESMGILGLETMAGFVRIYPDAPAEAAFIHTVAALKKITGTREPTPKWADMQVEARVTLEAFVEALRLADRLVAAQQAAQESEEPAKAPPPKIEDTIFETAGADEGEDEDLRPSPTAVVTPAAKPGEEQPALSAEA